MSVSESTHLWTCVPLAEVTTCYTGANTAPLVEHVFVPGLCIARQCSEDNVLGPEDVERDFGKDRERDVPLVRVESLVRAVASLVAKPVPKGRYHPEPQIHGTDPDCMSQDLVCMFTLDIDEVPDEVHDLFGVHVFGRWTGRCMRGCSHRRKRYN